MSLVLLNHVAVQHEKIAVLTVIAELLAHFDNIVLQKSAEDPSLKKPKADNNLERHDFAQRAAWFERLDHDGVKPDDSQHAEADTDRLDNLKPQMSELYVEALQTVMSGSLRDFLEDYAQELDDGILKHENPCDAWPVVSDVFLGGGARRV